VESQSAEVLIIGGGVVGCRGGEGGGDGPGLERRAAGDPRGL